MTVELITSRDVMAEITRHRLASFAIESQRYVCMKGEISFIQPECYIPGDTASAIWRMTMAEAVSYCRAQDLPLYGAALSPRDRDLRALRLDRSAVAIGSEGHGLSAELLGRCDGELIIPMSGEAESLNAGIAAAIVMWEMCRQEA